MPVIIDKNGQITSLPDNLLLRSNEVQEFVSHKPNLIIRWGSTIFFFILVGFAIICALIQYPDVVVTKARLNSINSPKEVITITEGKIQSILVKNGDSVSAEAILGFIKSIANPKAVYQLKAQLDAINNLVSLNRTNEIIQYFPDYTSQKFLSQLGELQQSFQTFMQSFISFKDFISNGFYLRKKVMLQTDMNNLLRLNVILISQKELLQQDLLLSDETYKANELLEKDKVISPLDYRNEKSKLIAKQLSLPQVNSAIVNNESQQNEKRKEIAELENQIIVQKNGFIQAVQTFGNLVQQWEYKYVLKAPISGKVLFGGFLQENQQVKNGQLLFYIQPDNTSFYAEMLIPQYNFGKVKAGQDVLLKFEAYPYEQFGSVTGKIEFISPIPTDSGFLAKVALPKVLTTNYNQTLGYQNGLFAKADIVTENMNLLERFYYNINKQLKR